MGWIVLIMFCMIALAFPATRLSGGFYMTNEPDYQPLDLSEDIAASATVTAEAKFEPSASESDAELNDVHSYPNVFRSGGQLVMAVGATLPPFCVKTNEPAAAVIKRKLRWHPPVFYLLLLFVCLCLPFVFTKPPNVMFMMVIASLAPYVITSGISARTAPIEIPVSETVQLKRYGWITLIVLLILIGFSMIVGNLFKPTDHWGRHDARFAGIMLLIGLIVFIVGIILSLVITKLVVRPTRIHGGYIWLKGVNWRYLERLPEWNPENVEREKI